MESHKSAFLTFDDGPSPFTPAILDILKQYQAPATFFMCGKNIERYPETAKRVKQEGHAVGKLLPDTAWHKKSIKPIRL